MLTADRKQIYGKLLFQSIKNALYGNLADSVIESHPPSVSIQLLFTTVSLVLCVVAIVSRIIVSFKFEH